MKLGRLFLICFLFMARTAFAFEVSATVDRNALNPDDTLTYTITVTSAEEVAASQPTLPPLSDFEVLNEWTSQESSATLSNGPNGPEFKTIRNLRYNYMLQPKREGVLSIGASEVVAEGRTYNTRPITIRVGPGLGSQSPPRNQRPQLPGGIQMPPGFEEDDEAEDLFSQLLRRHLPPSQQGSVGSRTLPINPNEAFFVQVDADKKEAYVGEQVTVSYYLYTRNQVRDLDNLKYPSLKGFWKEDIDIATHLNFTQEVVNGIPYRKALLATYALFPISAGQATVDSWTAKCTMVGVDSNFGFGRPYSFTKSSTPLKINVKPIPAEGRPADFTGAVGDFQVSARVEDNSVVSHQPFTYKVRFEGRGNAKLIELPPFTAPEGMELYDTQKEAKYFKTGTSYQDFSFLLIPRREGEFTMPSLSVSVFDPVQKKYVQKSTDPIRIIVGQGQAPAGGGESMSLGEKKKAIENVAPTVLTEFKEPRMLSTAQQTWIFFGLMIAAVVGLFLRARSELGWGQRKKDLSRRLRARLHRVNQKVSAGDWRGVGVEMTNTVYFILGEISGEGGANVEIGKLLMKAPPSVRRELGDAVVKKMDVFQILSFAPEAVVGSLKDGNELKKHVGEMSKLLERAVSLGSSDEQSSESELNPTAF
ncbi:MAG TPA: BatD family protein [Bdellovibrionales bacterium]|nr:BatD family protein [Bdellovibrionales bacterium]